MQLITSSEWVSILLFGCHFILCGFLDLAKWLLMYFLVVPWVFCVVSSVLLGCSWLLLVHYSVMNYMF